MLPFILEELQQPQSKPIEHNEYRYVINRRSGKVHTYSHGIEIIENPDNVIKANENLDNIYSKSGMQKLKNAEGEEIDREWKNYCVIYDSSKFAASVYYHYINKEIV